MKTWEVVRKAAEAYARAIVRNADKTYNGEKRRKAREASAQLMTAIEVVENALRSAYPDEFAEQQNLFHGGE